MAVKHTIIQTQADVERGVRALRRRCPFMRQAHDLTGMPPLRLSPGGFPGLFRIVVGQQVSVSSAAAIWERCQKTFDPMVAENILRRREPTFRKAGLSRPKIRTIRAVATAVHDGTLDFEAFSSMPAEEVHDALVALHGIGPWTADVYIMFCLGHADGWASGDLALQIAAQKLLELEERPEGDDFTALAARWRPWRSVAARLLWAYYAHLRAVKDAVPL